MILATLLLAAIPYDTTAVRVSVEPKPAYIEQSAAVQFVNCDLLIDNTTDQALDLDEVQLSVYDRAGKLVLRKFIDGNGTRPSIRTADLPDIAAKSRTMIFNPFHRFDRDLDLGALSFDLKFSSKDGAHLYAANVRVEPKPYATKAALRLPLQGRLLVYDGHDFYAHHRRWDYTIPGLQQLGFKTNFMRYSYDFVPVNDEGAMSHDDEEKNENWYGFGRDIRATADGTVAAVVDDQPDDRTFDPPSVLEHGTMRVWGNYVVIDHGRGEFSLFGHIRQGSGRVKVGQRVKRGDVIASIGASGSSKFPHLHYELQTGAGTDVEGLPSTFLDFVRVQGSRRVPVPSGLIESGELVESQK